MKYITNTQIILFLELLRMEFPRQYEAWDETDIDSMDSNANDFWWLINLSDTLVITFEVTSPFFCKRRGFFIYDNEEQVQDNQYIKLKVNREEFITAQEAINYIKSLYE